MEMIEVEGQPVKGENPPFSGAEQSTSPCEITVLHRPNPAEVRRFIQLLHDHARRAFEGAHDSGLLQLTAIHPVSKDLISVRFSIGQVDAMVATALTWADTGHNVYVEGRTVRKDLKKGLRGSAEDTRGVFAFVIDRDADKNMAGVVDFLCTWAIESSPGNEHSWLVLERAISAAEATPIGAALRKAVGADTDTGNITQPYRVPGTINYPDKKKRDRGRVTVATRILSLNGPLWTRDTLLGQFPPIEESKVEARSIPSGRTGRTSATVTAMFAELGDTHREGRSGQFMAAVAAAYRKGLSLDDIEDIARQNLNGCASKYLEGGDRLRKQIEDVLKKVAKDEQAKAQNSAFLPRGRIRRLSENLITGEQIEVHHARQIVKKAMALFFKHNGRPTLPLWEALNASPPPPRMLTSVQAMRVATGVGKTSATIEAVVDYVRELRAKGDLRKVVLLIPHHKLGDQIVKDFAELGVEARLYRGRDAEDPDAENPEPGKARVKMCLDLAAVRAAESIGATVETSCCSGKRPDGVKVDCSFKNLCGHQRQRHMNPDVWIAAHEYLFIDKPKAFGEVAKLVIDEGFWQAGIRLGSKGLTLDEVEASVGYSPMLDKFRRTLVQSLRAQPLPQQMRKDGLIPVERRFLHEAGLTVEDCEQARRIEWDGAQRPHLYPGMPVHERAELIANAHRPPKYVKRLAALWDAARDLLTQDEHAVSGRLFLQQQKTEEGRQWIVRTHGRREIAEGWRTVDTLLLDATLPPMEILNAFFPQWVELVADVSNVAFRHEYVRTRQVLFAPVAKGKLFDKTGKPILRNLKKLRRYILSRWIEVGRQPVVVACQGRKRDAGDDETISTPEDWLKANLPKEIAIVHFNALTGINEHSRARLLIVIGRVLPGPEEVELMAGAFTGGMPTPASAKSKDLTWYDTTEKLVRKRDGTVYGFTVGLKHPDRIAEMMRQLICEGQNTQTIGRVRAVNRDASTPRLDIDVLADLELDMVVDEVMCWPKPAKGDDDDDVADSKEIVPSVTGTGGATEMMADGWFMESPADMAAFWPDVWKDKKSAENWRAGNAPEFALFSLKGGIIKGKEGEIAPSWQAIEYRPKGRGQQTRKAYYDPSVIADPEAWLTERLGELAHYAPCAPSDAARPAAPSPESEATDAPARPPCAPPPPPPPVRPIPPWWKDGQPPLPRMPSPPPWPGGPEHMSFFPPPIFGPPPWMTRR